MRYHTASGPIIVICSLLLAAVGCVDATRPTRDDLVDEDAQSEASDVSEPKDVAAEDTTSSDDGEDVEASDTEEGGEDSSSDTSSDTGTDGGGDQTEDTGCRDPGCPCNYEGTPQGVCSDATTDSAGNCQPPSEYEGDEQTCDGLDNDCDGDVDEGCDDDGDGYCDGQMSVAGSASVCPNGGGDCNDRDPSVNPGANEFCDDNVDNDCDGDTDCNDTDCNGRPVCSSGGTERLCGDGRDNDGDGCTDCNDADCASRSCGPNEVCCPGLPSPGQCVSGSCVQQGQPCPR